MRSIQECEHRLLCIARDRHRDGRAAHVIDCECVLAEDAATVMVYWIFGLPGDDPCGADVADIAGIYYELPGPIAEADFDACAAAAAFEATVTAINNRTAFLVS
jgi:hypothetical protein